MIFLFLLAPHFAISIFNHIPFITVPISIFISFFLSYPSSFIQCFLINLPPFTYTFVFSPISNLNQTRVQKTKKRKTQRMATDKPSTPSRGQAWFCTIGLPSDVVVDVDDMTFHLHKFPLMSKSKKLHDLIAEQESKHGPKPPPKSSHKGKFKEGERETDLDNDNDNDSSEIEAIHDNDDEDEDEDEELEQDHCHVSFPSFPGGSETFETAAKFCYGVKINITAGKVAPLRCAGEVLEMTEEYYEDNLISKTERFFTQSVLKNIKDSIKALKSCEKLSPLAENLGIVQRCIEAISSKAVLYDPTLFGWPVNDTASIAAATETQRKKTTANTAAPANNVRDSWVEDLAQLSFELFNRVISAMREKELNPEIIESCLIQYAKTCFPGITRSNRKLSSSSIASEAEQREILETIVSNLPPEKSSLSPSTTRYLFGLLRTANILCASEECKSALERKIGTQLDQATLDDVLIPSYSYLNETLYDVDCVQRILGHFLGMNADGEIEGDPWVGKSPRNTRSATIMLVGKLIDGYLSEIASDANLKVEKFYELAISLPEQARLYDDGIYRAIDVYLKAHSWITEGEREKICGLMDCQKLTLEACTHAAQNERLPLRAVVQVLFFEQLQLRHAIAGTLITATDAVSLTSGAQSGNDNDEEEEEEEEEERENGGGFTRVAVQEKSKTWKEAIRENQVLRLDMDSMRTRVHELERECSTMKKVIEKIDKMGSPQNGKTWRSSITRKFGCKFKTQVCDSHESTVVAESRRGRHRNQR